ncbi:hypothetical protein V9T40_003671 [Parthenolecanium corni]|uniref:Uncharacterized protein n=1 Tax=Parthenolecanium corni TaxID=536013 RepID=A0AAN9TTZ1_9HEMI
MENFVDAVHEMDDTILVPSRLMDLKVDTTKPEFAAGRSSSSLVALLSTLPDLFTLYTMVRALKNQLQWGGREPTGFGCGAAAAATTTDDNSSSAAGQLAAHFASSVFLGAPMLAAKGHARRPSTASMSSTNSSTTSSVISEPDSEASSIENDSGIDAELEACTKSISAVELIEQNFQRHLRGLGDTLNQLTEAARYVTKRYQKDVLGIE